MDNNDTKSSSPLLKSFSQNFISRELEKDGITFEYLALLKILWYGFDEIVSRTKIPRRIFILELLEKYLGDEKFRKSIDILEIQKSEAFVESQGLETPQLKLKHIDIVNFRGFRVNPDDNGRIILFDKKATLFFAPNGGGKTSLCEALEWSLTGDTLEHSQRSIEPADKYFQNRDLNEPSYKKTSLSLLEGFSPEIPNIVYDRCFLEKNRIEKFAKIATQKGTDVQKILGELFGLAEIVDFFNEFGQDLSPTAFEKDERENWQTWLDWDVKKRDLERIIKESSQEEKMAKTELSKLLGGKSYGKKKKEVEDEIKKLAKELEDLGIDRSMQFSAKTFQDDIKKVFKKVKRWKECRQEISKFASDLDFENLYQAANKIFESNYEDNKCPLCDTPIKPIKGILIGHKCVVTDPREKTKNELKKLETLTKLKSEKTSLESEIRSQIFPNIKAQWNNIQHNLSNENWMAIAGDTSKPKVPSIDILPIESTIYENFEGFANKYGAVLTKDFSELSAIEKTILTYKQKRQELQKKKQKQEEVIRKLRELFGKLQLNYEELSNKKAIRKRNELRLKSLMKQSDNSIFFKKLLEEYGKYYSSLQDFQTDVILAEAKDIDELVTGFYRALNLHDHDGELIKNINFPKRVQEDFCLTFEKGENTVCNALQILSEGHLRTLGLASLLARAAKLNTSLLVFDDAINAVDSDHRDNIAHFIAGKFTDEQGKFAFNDKWKQIKKYLKQCQFVITSHDRFFDEKIANLFDKENQTRYVLYYNQNGIDYCEKGTPANFEKKIEGYLNPDTQDIRSAVFYCRIWLEEILLSIAVNFRKPSNNKPIEFSNIVDRKTRSLKNPELVTLLNDLISNLKKDGTTVDDKKIAGILEKIVQEKDGKYIWFFEILNQESHYRRYDHIDISNAPTSREVENIFNSIQQINLLNKHN